MNIGIPKERRAFEFRVGMTPTGVETLTQAGHTCYVEHEAGLGAGFSDLEYERAGARIVYSSEEAFGRADLLLKVARPLAEEIEWLRTGTTIAGLLHLSSARQDKIDLLHKNQITAVSYEQISLDDGTVPVRMPLSQICGRLIAQISARLLQNNSGGKGILLSGIASVPPAEVAIIGAGVVGFNGARAFLGMGAHVIVLDRDLNALQRVHDALPGAVTMMASPRNISKVCTFSDIIVGAIYAPDEQPDIIITREMVCAMKPRSIIMDISIDEGGCVETSRPTTHEHSYYVEEGIIHYCVPNIPSVVARTSTYAFINAATPFVMEIAAKGIDTAIKDNSAIKRGVTIHRGELAHITRLKINK
jgi:alanine dehydrogenase